jgi:hypothetical protein
MARPGYWNHNVHYQPVILRAVPPGCGAALEVGCGDGLLASRLAVIGLAAHGSFGDYLADAPGIPLGLAYRAVRGKGDPGAPIMDPEMIWADVRAAARRLLPGVRYRRHLLFRYSLRWRKPRG